MIFLKNRLANYDLATADFYIRREAWIAAIQPLPANTTFTQYEAARNH